jgi:hypothetical protein
MTSDDIPDISQKPFYLFTNSEYNEDGTLTIMGGMVGNIGDIDIEYIDNPETAIEECFKAYLQGRAVFLLLTPDQFILPINNIDPIDKSFLECSYYIEGIFIHASVNSDGIVQLDFYEQGELIVNVSSDESGVGTTNTTMEEIRTAIDFGRSVVCELNSPTVNGFRIPLTIVENNTFCFIKNVSSTIAELVIIQEIDGMMIVGVEEVAATITINDKVYDGDASIDFTETINNMIDAKTDKLTASDVGALPNTVVIPTVPSALKNPHALTFTGAVSGTYDGSAAKTINIPTATSLANALTFTGAVTGSYNGSAAKTVNIPTVPTSLKNPNALTINGTTYDGSSAINYTTIINNMIDEKLGVIENGSY